MATVSIDEALKTFPALLQLARSESVIIRDEDGEAALLMSLRPKTEEERILAVRKLEETSRIASEELAANLAKDGISTEDFLRDALADV